MSKLNRRKVSRRNFIAGASSIPFALWLQSCGTGGNGGTGGDGGDDAGDGGGDGGGGDGGGGAARVRYDARSPQGQAMLQSYADAVESMKDSGIIQEGDPLSWVFQWYIHGVKSSTTKAAEIARIYPTPSADRDLAQEVWNTCQAHYPGDNESFFLPWHRMYVYFFESIIRQVSGNQDFTLPYWNYSSVGATRGVIPPEFGDAASSLFVGKRNPGVNAGQPIQQGQPGDPLSLVSLEECAYDPSGARSGFNMRLDFGLHGNIHVLTGNGENMGSVPWAAGDPIFWMHHCNIDRLWASWNAAGRQNPTGAQWLDKTFTFADSAGLKVVAKVSDFDEIAPLGYSYDRLEPVPPCAADVGGLTDEAMMRRGAAGAPVTLGAAPVRVSLPTQTGDEDFSLTAGVETLDQRRLYVVAKGLETQVQPGVLYHVYLGLPAGSDPQGHESHYVGSLNFFGSHGGHGETHDVTPSGPEKFVSFDITEVARRLKTEDALDAEPSVTIAPAGEPDSAAQPVLGELTLVEQ